MYALHGEIHAEQEDCYIRNDADKGWWIFTYFCPACGRANMFLVNGISKISAQHVLKEEISRTAIRPKHSSRPPCPSEVPPDIAEDYKEACLVLSDSPKASAALSRRCLQNLLRNVAGVNPSDLANEIQEVLNKKQLPSHLADLIDAVRVVGNFAAHPI